MEPVSTLAEISRILTLGGVFATVDCDWPPLSDWRVDQAYEELFERIYDIENSNPATKENAPPEITGEAFSRLLAQAYEIRPQAPRETS